MPDAEDFRIVLRSSTGDDPFAGPDSGYARDLKQFLSVAASQGGQIVPPRLAMDSIEIQTLLAFVQPLGHDALKILGPALLAWLHGRAGRRIEVSGFGIKIKANTVEDAKRLIEKLSELRDTQRAPTKRQKKDHS